MVDKAALKVELVAAITASLETARAAYAAAVEGATHSEARAENDKDTRGLEQSYLARGQAQRVAELETGLRRVVAFAMPAFDDDDAIAIGALVTLVDEPLQLLVAHDGGGTLLASGRIQVVTPQSPLGRALLGRRVDDEVEIRLPTSLRVMTIASIA